MSKESRIIKETPKESDIAVSMVIRSLMKLLAEQGQFSNIMSSVIFHDLGYILAKEKSEKLGAESAFTYWLSAIASYHLRQSSKAGVERRFTQLERVTSLHNSAIRRLEASIAISEAEEEEEQQWPAFTSEELGKMVENARDIENAGEDKALMIYHIMEIEALLGKIEGKARVTNREYEARLAASLRDICRIHEPAELSDEQIKCFTGSLQALAEGWGELNREKVKWIRGRLLEVGLTWLPVTEKAQKVIDEAKSSVK